VAATKRLEQGCPLSPLLCLQYTNDLGRLLNTPERGALTALEAIQVSHTEYADDIALVANTAQQLQFQLDRFYDYTYIKGLMLSTDTMDQGNGFLLFQQPNQLMSTMAPHLIMCKDLNTWVFS